MDVVLAEKFQESAELSDAEPFDNVGVVANYWIGFVGESSDDNFFHASFARSGRKLARINAVARDDSEKL